MNEPTRIDSDLNIQKTEVFETYLLWRTIPTLVKYPPKDKNTGESPDAQLFAQSMGIEDPIVLDLITIKTQKDFSDRFNVDEDTLTAWNKKINKRDTLKDLRSWALPLTRNVMLSLYNQTVRGGLPQHYKLWFQAVNEWSEKLQLEHGYRGVAQVNIRTRNDSKPT